MNLHYEILDYYKSQLEKGMFDREWRKLEVYILRACSIYY